MTEEELKGKLTEILLGARNNAILDESEVSVDDMCVIGVRMVFELFKQANYVQLDPDQRLPDEISANDQGYWAYKRGQQDMLNVGFKKVR